MIEFSNGKIRISAITTQLGSGYGEVLLDGLYSKLDTYNINANQNRIRNLADPIYPQDAVNKQYIDSLDIKPKGGTTNYEIWDGTISTSFEGEGTEENPYIISTPAQLAGIVNSFGGGHYYKLTNDIFLNDIFNGIWENEWFFSTLYGSWPGSREYVYHTNNDVGHKGRFSGHIDGNGYTVYGLYHSGTSTQGDVFETSLIPVMKNGSIKNLNIDVANLRAGENVAAFVARTNGNGWQNDSITIENCSVQQNVSLYAFSGIPKIDWDGSSKIIDDAASSGVVAYAMNSVDLTIKNCYCLSEKIFGDKNYDYFKYTGILGQSWNSYYKILNCYSLISPFNITDTNERISLHGISAYNNIYTCTTRSVKPSESSYFTLLTKEDMFGPNSLEKMPGLIDGGFIATQDYPIIQHLINNTADNLAIQNMLGLAGMAAALNGMSNMTSNLKVEIKNVNGALGTTQIPAGKIKVEPNKFYVASSQTSQGGVSFTAWTGTEVGTYSAKLVMMFVGNKVNGIAPGYVVQISGGTIPSFSPWPLMQGAINDNVIVNGQGFVSEIELDQNGTIMILN